MSASTTIEPGVIASAEFVGAHGSRVFCVKTSPLGTPDHSVVICPPFGGEAPRNYRREVQLARRLARLDIETIRFHYRGTGHSDPLGAPSFAAMLQDASAIASTVDADTTWMGTRLGSLVAATVATGPLILWDPLLDADAYFREILRASVFSAFKSDDPGTAPKTDLIRHLESEEEIDLLGYRMTSRFRQEVCEARPLRDLAGDARRTLMVDIRRRGTPRNETGRLAEVWRSAGSEVTVDAVPLNEPWWYGARAGTSAQEAEAANDRLLAITTDFVTDFDLVAP